MFKQCLAGLALATVLGWTVSAQDANTVITNASKAIGVNALKTVQYSGSGMDFAFGQAPNPSSPWPKFIVKSYTRAINFETPASRADLVRLQGENPPRGGTQPILGEQKQNRTIIVNPNTPWVQQLEIWMMPHGFLRAAATKNATVEAKKMGGKRYQVVTFMGDNRAKVNGYINDQNLVERVETWIDNPVLGDTLLEALYSDYQDAGGVQFPMHIVQKQGGYPILDLNVRDAQANAAVTIEAPPAPAAAPANPPAASEKLGDGVYLITGGYAVIAVDFKDYIVVIESGQSEARALAVIAEAKRLIPNKPIKYLINTHSHFDHSGGLRGFVAEGTTILTHQINRAYLEKVLSQPHTLNPDKAEQAKKKPVVEGMGTKKVLTDGTHVIELYHLEDFRHHDGMIVAYLPKERVLLEADGYNATGQFNTGPSSPYFVSLIDNIQRLKLDVQRVVPVHYPADNHVVTMTDLMRLMGRTN